MYGLADLRDMGRTTPTTREAIRQRFEEWDDFRRCLRREYQGAFDKVRERVDNRAHTGTVFTATDIETQIWLSLAVSQEKELERLQERIDELEECVEELAE